jgi:hypothetical protein
MFITITSTACEYSPHSIIIFPRCRDHSCKTVDCWLLINWRVQCLRRLSGFLRSLHLRATMSYTVDSKAFDSFWDDLVICASQTMVNAIKYEGNSFSDERPTGFALFLRLITVFIQCAAHNRIVSQASTSTSSCFPYIRSLVGKPRAPNFL